MPPQYPPPDHDHRAGSSAGGDGLVGVRDLPRQRPIQPAVAEPAGPVTGRATSRRPGIWSGDRGTGATTGHRGGRRPASNRHSGNARARCDRYQPERSAVVPVAHRQSGATGTGALDRSDRGFGGGTTPAVCRSGAAATPLIFHLRAGSTALGSSGCRIIGGRRASPLAATPALGFGRRSAGVRRCRGSRALDRSATIGRHPPNRRGDPAHQKRRSRRAGPPNRRLRWARSKKA